MVHWCECRVHMEITPKKMESMGHEVGVSQYLHIAQIPIHSMQENVPAHL